MLMLQPRTPLGLLATHQATMFSPSLWILVHFLMVCLMLSLKFHPQMVTGIQHLQTPISSFIAPKMHFQRAQTIQLVKKLTCTEALHEARAHA
jgi:hypothetical protein